MEKYFEILEDTSLDTDLLYCLSCVKNYNDLSDKETMEKQANIIKRVWLKLDSDMSISAITDIVCENWEDIKENEFDLHYIIDLI